jgi:hypothetical protein
LDSNTGKLSKYRQISGIVLAAVILTIIFVPFQTANAFTVELDLPDSDDDTVPQSPQGEPFEITIDVETGELISIESIEVILDNDEPSVKRAVFDDEGIHITGSSNLVINNVVEISGDLDDTGYGYGFGLVSDGTTFIPSYSYSFSYSYGFIGGNTGGYTTAGTTDFVTGLLGPGTITISGNMRTADLAEGTHTLDVLVDTGANGIGNEDQLVAPQLSFEVEETEGIEVEDETIPGGTSDIEIETDLVFDNGQTQTVSFNFETSLITSITTSISSIPTRVFDASMFTLAADLIETNNGVEFESDNGERFVIKGAISDISFSDVQTVVDAGGVTIGLSYDDESMSDDEEEAMRLHHFNDDTEEWEELTNDNPAVNGGEEVDTSNNIVYGTTDDFSLFAPAFSIGGGTSGGGGGGGSGGTGGGSSVVVNQTFPPSYFETHPLSKVQVEEATIVTSSGTSVLQGAPGQQVSLMAEFRNFQTAEQDYAIIFQVINEDGFTEDIGWVTGTLASGDDTQASRSWTIGAEGNYTVKIFVWNGVSELPTPLSQVTEKSFTSS